MDAGREKAGPTALRVLLQGTGPCPGWQAEHGVYQQGFFLRGSREGPPSS